MPSTVRGINTARLSCYALAGIRALPDFSRARYAAERFSVKLCRLKGLASDGEHGFRSARPFWPV